MSSTSHYDHVEARGAANKNRARPRECSCSMFGREPPWRDFWIFEIAHRPPYYHYQGSLESAAFSAARMKPFKSPSDVFFQVALANASANGVLLSPQALHPSDDLLGDFRL